MVGGPIGGTAPVSGTVWATNDRTGHYVIASVRHGVFTIALVPGRYHFVGRSPQWYAGAACPTMGPVVLETAVDGARVDITCPRM